MYTVALTLTLVLVTSAHGALVEENCEKKALESWNWAHREYQFADKAESIISLKLLGEHGETAQGTCKNGSFGFNNTMLWVNDGCRGDFSVCYARKRMTDNTDEAALGMTDNTDEAALGMTDNTDEDFGLLGEVIQAKVNQLEKKLRPELDQITDMNSKFTDLQDKITAQQSKISQLKGSCGKKDQQNALEQINHLKTCINKDPQAFHYYTMSTRVFKGTINFNKKITSTVGTSYSNGVFTASTSGTYLFVAHVIPHHSKGLMIQIVVNGAPVSSVHAYDDVSYAGGVVSAVVKLSQGQQVSVTSLRNTKLFGDIPRVHYFMGYSLQPHC